MPNRRRQDHGVGSRLGPLHGLAKHPLLATMAAIGGVAWLAGSVGVRIPWLLRRSRRRLPQSPGLDVTLASLDGLDLAATYWPGARNEAPGILIVHGIAASRRVVAPNAAWLAARGYAVLAIDLRGHGDSARAPTGFGWPESQDTQAAFAWLKRRQTNAPCAIIGISMGGASALIGPLGPVRADALVLQGVYATFRQTVRSRCVLAAGAVLGRLIEPLLSFQTVPRLGVWPARLAPIAAIATVPCPVLVIGGETDVFTPPHETRALCEAALGRRALWIAPGLDHAGVSDTCGDDYRARVLAFLTAAIGAP